MVFAVQKMFSRFTNVAVPVRCENFRYSIHLSSTVPFRSSLKKPYATVGGWRALVISVLHFCHNYSTTRRTIEGRSKIKRRILVSPRKFNKERSSLFIGFHVLQSTRRGDSSCFNRILTQIFLHRRSISCLVNQKPGL